METQVVLVEELTDCLAGGVSEMIFSNKNYIYKRQGSTLLLVLWTIGVTTLIVLSLQLSAYRQAMSGRESLGKVRARWAARAGVESMIAYIAWETDSDLEYNPIDFADQLVARARNEPDDLNNANYYIQNTREKFTLDGPADVHAKLNINTMTENQLMMLPDITEEMVASIMDWIDTDDDAREGGAEIEYYVQLMNSYEPRNGPLQSLQELEIIHSITPELVRGEDWNLNGLLDPNENDGDLSWPPDNEDGYLDAGWSELITTESVGGGLAYSGDPRIDLATAEIDEITQRLDVNYDQAQALSNFARSGSSVGLATLLTTPLSQLAATSGSGGSGGGNNNPVRADDLDYDQLRRIFAEATIRGAGDSEPGKLNINTCNKELLYYLVSEDNMTLMDQIDFDRQSIPFSSIVDLKDVQGMEPALLTQLYDLVDVRSNCFQITSKGKAVPGNAEVELVVTIDRSSLPIRIINYIEK